MCPVCTVAVGAGLGLSRALGIDDVLTSVWVGGLILSVAFWFYQWLVKRWPLFKKPLYLYLVIAITYGLTLYPLSWGKYIGRVTNTLWGMDKIVLGTALGSVFFLLGLWLDKKQRQKYTKQWFNYQKVVFPVSALIFCSLLLYSFL